MYSEQFIFCHRCIILLLRVRRGTARAHHPILRTGRHPCAMSMHVVVCCLEKYFMVIDFVLKKIGIDRSTLAKVTTWKQSTHQSIPQTRNLELHSANENDHTSDPNRHWRGTNSKRKPNSNETVSEVIGRRLLIPFDSETVKQGVDSATVLKPCFTCAEAVQWKEKK